MPAHCGTTSYQMQEQLQYVLSNLDVENVSDELGAKLRKLQ